jgi:hypothetical protein
MSRYTWGVDGYGRAHICREGEWVVLFSMIDGHCGLVGKRLFEEQELNENALPNKTILS